jgi:hypothetical protein
MNWASSIDVPQGQWLVFAASFFFDAQSLKMAMVFSWFVRRQFPATSAGVHLGGDTGLLQVFNLMCLKTLFVTLSVP